MVTRAAYCCSLLLAATPAAAQEAIIVTARLRPERINEVPISIAERDAERIERMNARELADVARSIPNLAIPATGVLGAGQPTIRGLYSAAGAATVGLYLDDTPIQLRPLLFAASPNPDIFDLDRIEILRGPQGTLFGASSLGGTIRLITRQPDLARATGEAVADLRAIEGGGFGGRLSAAAGGPIVADRLGFRIGGAYSRDGGVVDRADPVTGALIGRNVDRSETVALRAALTARLGERVTLTPSLLYQQRRSDDLPFAQSDREPDEQAFLVAQPGRDAFGLASLKAEVDLGNSRLTSITSHYERRDRRVADYSTAFGELVLGGAVPGLTPPGGTSSRTRIDQRDWSQELRLTVTAAGPLEWVVGAFYQRSRIDLLQEVSEPGIATLVEDLIGGSVADVFGLGLLPGGISYRGIEHATETRLAAFGEVDWELGDGLAAIAGLRLSRSRLDLSVDSEGPYAGPGENRVDVDRTEYPLTPRLGVSYAPNRALRLYATASRGFRAGGANTPVPVSPCQADLAAIGRTTAPASYGSDRVWNYELGAKGDWAERGLQVRAALFQIEWSRVQQLISLPTCGFSFVDNLGTARSRGFELEAEFRPTPSLLLSAGLGHADARFRRSLFSAAGPDGGAPALLAARGDRVPFVSDWTANAAAEQGWAVNAGRAYVRSELHYNGAYHRTPAAPAVGYNPLVFDGDSYANVMLRAGFEAARWSAALWVDNLLDDRSILFRSADLVPATGSPLRQSRLRPRSFGLTARLFY